MWVVFGEGVRLHGFVDIEYDLVRDLVADRPQENADIGEARRRDQLVEVGASQRPRKQAMRTRLDG